MKKLFFIAVGMLLSSSVFADSWGEFMDRRVVDSTGTHYVVLAKASGWGEDPGRGGPVRYTIAERRETSEVQAAADRIDRDDFKVIKDRIFAVRAGDKMLGTGMLQRAPREVHISSQGNGFVALDVYGYNYSDASTKRALIYVANDGRIGFRKSWGEIFQEDEIPLFATTAGGTNWIHASWIDDRNARVIVVGRVYQNRHAASFGEGPRRFLFRSVLIPSGEVKAVTKDVVIDCLRQRDPGNLARAISLADELDMPNLEPLMRAIAQDKTIPEKIRTQALTVLHESESTSNRD